MALPACKVDAPSNSAVPSGKFGLFSVGADAQGTSTNFCLLGTTSSLSAISRDILLELLCENLLIQCGRRMSVPPRVASSPPSV